MESFEHAAALEVGELRQLFEHGRPEQRMWAIWVLALRADASLDPAQRIDSEPDAGVRRSLAVMLAGQGKGWLVVALARHDPELVVRETAIQLATRLACGGALDVALIVRLCEREPALRIAALGAIGSGAPEVLVQLARSQLESREHEVQLEAFETLVRIGTPETRELARSWMVRRNDMLLCDRWLRAASAESLAEAFAAAPEATRARVLSRLASPPWRAVELLVGTSDRLLAAVLDRNDIAIPARVTAGAILRGSHGCFVERLTAQLDGAARGRTLLADIRAALERDLDPATARAQIAHARAFGAALEIAAAAPVLDELADLHPVEQLVGLENAIGRWLTDVDAPAELIPLLPELHRHVTQELAAIERTGALVDDMRLLPGTAPDDSGPVPIRAYQDGRRFTRLRVALERLLR